MCNKQYNKNYRDKLKKNPIKLESHKQRQRNWYIRNRDRILAKKMELYPINKEAMNATKRHTRSEFGKMCRLYNADYQFITKEKKHIIVSFD